LIHLRIIVVEGKAAAGGVAAAAGAGAMAKAKSAAASVLRSSPATMFPLQRSGRRASNNPWALLGVAQGEQFVGAICGLRRCEITAAL
jgi:hypothetical protein